MNKRLGVFIFVVAFNLVSQEVEENPEKIVDTTIQKQSSTIQSLQTAQKKIDELRNINFWKREYKLCTFFPNFLFSCQNFIFKMPWKN